MAHLLLSMLMLAVTIASGMASSATTSAPRPQAVSDDAGQDSTDSLLGYSSLIVVGRLASPPSVRSDRDTLWITSDFAVSEVLKGTLNSKTQIRCVALWPVARGPSPLLQAVGDQVLFFAKSGGIENPVWVLMTSTNAIQPADPRLIGSLKQRLAPGPVPPFNWLRPSGGEQRTKLDVRISSVTNTIRPVQVTHPWGARYETVLPVRIENHSPGAITASIPQAGFSGPWPKSDLGIAVRRLDQPAACWLANNAYLLQGSEPPAHSTVWQPGQSRRLSLNLSWAATDHSARSASSLIRPDYPGKYAVTVSLTFSNQDRSEYVVSPEMNLEVLGAPPVPEEPDEPADLSPHPSPEPGWGEVVAGTSVRLQADKTVWESGLIPSFKVSVRNLGDRRPWIATNQLGLGEFEVDGVSYLLDGHQPGGPVLGPGDRRDDIPVSFSGKWFSKLREPLLLRQGRHTVRFAVVPTAWSGKWAGRLDQSIPWQTRLVSNPVEIEVHTADPEYEAAMRAAGGPDEVPRDGPALAELGGSVVDDETGEPVTDFWLQAGAADPKDPAKVTWSFGHVGPIIGQIGRFSLQSWSRWTTWRVLADGYLPEQVVKVPLFPSTRAGDLVVRLKRGGALNGLVLDHKGRPVADASVFLVTEQRLDLTDGVPNSTFRGSTASTDASGRFALRGLSGAEQKVVVFLADGLEAGFSRKLEPGQEWEITLPEPAALLVRLDIPGAGAEAWLGLRRRGQPAPFQYSLMGSELKPSVPNPGQILLTNLTPGEYDFNRTKMLRVPGVFARGAWCDRQTLFLKPGETQRVDLVRSAGYPLHGEVTGLDQTTARGGHVYVRSPGATGDARARSEWSLPCFDALTFGADGRFETARLEPGNYTVVVEVFEPEPPSSVFRSGIRLPNYTGIAKVTITADTPPPLVKIPIHPPASVR